jgi:hypothetical protein
MDLVDYRNHYVMSKLGAMIFRLGYHDKFMKSTNINLFHFNLGIMIRNNWHLWDEENMDNELIKFFNFYGIYHPDNMSSIILQSYHNILHDKDMNFLKMIQYYSEYENNQELEELESVEE